MLKRSTSLMVIVVVGLCLTGYMACEVRADDRADRKVMQDGDRSHRGARDLDRRKKMMAKGRVLRAESSRSERNERQARRRAKRLAQREREQRRDARAVDDRRYRSHHRGDAVVHTRVDYGNRRIVHDVHRAVHHSPVVIHRSSPVIVVPNRHRHDSYRRGHASRHASSWHSGHHRGRYHRGGFHGEFVWRSGGCGSRGGITLRIPF